MKTLAEVTKEALALSVDERVVLAQSVWDSVEHFANADIEKAWMEEADRRWRQIEKGEATCVPAEVVMHNARARLAK